MDSVPLVWGTVIVDELGTVGANTGAFGVTEMVLIVAL